MTVKYNDKQRNFSFSMFAYLGTNLNGSAEVIEKELKARLIKIIAEPEVEDVLGKWELVWGPVVFQSRNSDGADNVMYVVKSTQADSGKPEYVIAIAGTYPNSRLDVIIEDAMVGNLVNFRRFPLRSKIKISRGTNIGYRILKGMECDFESGESQSLIEFLSEDVKIAGTKVTTTGHSLGGALCAPLALWLQDTRKEWDINKFATLSTYPYANPTSGNGPFSDEVSDKLEGEVCRTWNDLDVPSYWWKKTDLEKIPTLYAPHIEPDLLIKAFAKILIKLANGNDYIQVDKDANALKGTFNEQASDSTAVPFKQFVAQMKYQHVNGYFELLDTSVIGLAIKKIMGDTESSVESEKSYARLKALIEKLT